MMQLILADNQAIFRAGAARVLAREEDLRLVAQCEEPLRLIAAIDAHRGAIILLASTLCPDLARTLPQLAAHVASRSSRLILIAENSEHLPDDLVTLLDGILTRRVTGPDLIDCVRTVARGQRSIHRANVTTMHAADTVGTSVRDRLTPKEMQIVALIVQGCKNKDIAAQLGTKEQVIKNYLRSIYDKSGVSDRLELALFTIHHRVLAEAAAKVGDQLLRKTA